MSLLPSIAKLGAGVGALQSIINTVFPNNILIKYVKDDGTEVAVYLDATEDITKTASSSISDAPSEDKKVYVQNLSNNPRTINLSSVLSNVITLSRINTLSAAADYAAALLIPEAANLTSLLTNEEDSIEERLRQLRDAKDNGYVVNVIGLPDQTTFNYIIESIEDTATTQIGKSRIVNISLREAFIVGLNKPVVQDGPIAAVVKRITGSVPAGLR